jgi:hypothetical protein
MKSDLNKRHLQILLVPLAVATLMTGCISFDFPKLGGDIGTLIDERLEPCSKLADASQVYYRCCGKWPSTVDDLRSTNCADVEKRWKISNILANIQWNTFSNAVFKTESDGDLTISMDLNPGTLSTTNGTSMSFSAGSISETLSIPSTDDN